ncbi:MAG: archease [Planctomycetaceae bacterium]|nr:archease [Planctomycetaceae bacterium]
MSWELIDHTGDLGVVARSATLEELFADCARAMFSILADAPAPAPAGTETFPVAGAEPADELRDFLSELLYRFSAEHRMYVAFRPAAGAVAADWEPYDEVRHPLRTELKAVTWHQLEAVREGPGWRGRVIFDV